MITILVALLGTGFHLTASQLEKQAEKTIKKFLKEDVTFESKTIALTGDLKAGIEAKTGNRFYTSAVTFWNIKAKDQTIAHALMDEVEAKSGTITYVTMFDPKGAVTMVRVIKYRPQYGSEVKNKQWLRKFNGKDASSALKPGKDIDTVSGATISSTAITEGIQRLTHLILQVK